jgi:acyl carrier protein
MDYDSKVREFIIENFLFGNGEALSDDTSFMENGIIDSTGILELVMFLEQTYGIKIEDEELVPENLDSLMNIGRFLAGKVKSSGQGVSETVTD